MKLGQGDALKDANLFAGPTTPVLFGAGGGWSVWSTDQPPLPWMGRWYLLLERFYLFEKNN